MTRFGGDCYLYCLLAMGLIDIVAEASLKPFDIAPLDSDHPGGRWRRHHLGRRRSGGGGRILAVGEPSLHEAAMQALAAAIDSARIGPPLIDKVLWASCLEPDQANMPGGRLGGESK